MAGVVLAVGLSFAAAIWSAKLGVGGGSKEAGFAVGEAFRSATPKANAGESGGPLSVSEPDSAFEVLRSASSRKLKPTRFGVSAAAFSAAAFSAAAAAAFSAAVLSAAAATAACCARSRRCRWCCPAC